jgi:hypothetical protein
MDFVDKRAEPIWIEVWCDGSKFWIENRPLAGSFFRELFSVGPEEELYLQEKRREVPVLTRDEYRVKSGATFFTRDPLEAHGKILPFPVYRAKLRSGRSGS